MNNSTTWSMGRELIYTTTVCRPVPTQIGAYRLAPLLNQEQREQLIQVIETDVCLHFVTEDLARAEDRLKAELGENASQIPIHEFEQPQFDKYRATNSVSARRQNLQVESYVMSVLAHASAFVDRIVGLTKLLHLDDPIHIWPHLTSLGERNGDIARLMAIESPRDQDVLGKLVQWRNLRTHQHHFFAYVIGPTPYDVWYSGEVLRPHGGFEAGTVQFCGRELTEVLVELEHFSEWWIEDLRQGLDGRKTA